jgi:hypothetical protein
MKTLTKPTLFFLACQLVLVSLACRSSAPTPLPPTQAALPTAQPVATETPIPPSLPTVTDIPTEPPPTTTQIQPSATLAILDFRPMYGITLLVDYQAPDLLYAASQDGRFVSEDGGLNWKHVKADSSLSEIQHATELAYLWQNPHSPTTFYGIAEASQSFVKSSDGGQNWETLAVPFDVMSLVIGAGILEFDPQNPNILFVTSFTTIHKSADGGQSWHEVGGLPEPGPSGLNFKQFIFDSSVPNTMYVLDLFWGAFKSTDSGENWISLSRSDGQNSFYARWLVIDPTNPNMLYAVNNANGKTYTSSDGGQTWAETDFGLPAGDLLTFAIHPHNPSIRYAILSTGEISGLFKSIDGGQNWNEIPAVILP